MNLETTLKLIAARNEVKRRSESITRGRTANTKKPENVYLVSESYRYHQEQNYLSIDKATSAVRLISQVKASIQYWLQVTPSALSRNCEVYWLHSLLVLLGGAESDLDELNGRLVSAQYLPRKGDKPHA